MEICWTDTDASMIKSWKYVGCILMHDEDLERSIAQGDLRKKTKTYPILAQCESWLKIF